MKYLPIFVLGFLFILATYVALWFSVFDLTVVRYNSIEISNESVHYESGYSYEVVISRNEPVSYDYRDWVPGSAIYSRYAWISSAFYPLHKISFLVNGVRSTEPTKDVRNISGIK